MQHTCAFIVTQDIGNTPATQTHLLTVHMHYGRCLKPLETARGAAYPGEAYRVIPG
jgi:hypothetical protein